MTLFQLATPFNTCLCTHMNRPVLSVPQGDVPTWATSQETVMECVVDCAVAGVGCVETAVFTKAVWTTMTAVQNLDFGALLASLHLVSAARAIPVE